MKTYSQDLMKNERPNFIFPISDRDCVKNNDLQVPNSLG